MKKYFFLVWAIIILTIFITSCSREEPFVAPPPPPPVVNVTINEIYSQGTVGNEDWVEIYNPATSAKSISGYKIYDSGGKSGSKPKKTFPPGSSIPAGGFLVITVDDTAASGFGLSSSGETIWLEDSTGILIDSIAFPALGVDTTYGRKPNGSSTLSKLSPPTKGQSNGTGGGTLLPVMMNEIFSRGIPVTDPDWIEIFNPNSVSVDLTGYKVYDGGGNLGSKPKKLFPAGTIVPANGYFVIVTDVADSSGFGLSSGGEEVWLETPSGAVIDNIAFTAMDVTQSFCRLPNGSATWALSSTITRGTPNKP